MLCPGLVRTNIADSECHRPAELGNEAVAMTPERQAGLLAFNAAIETSMPPVQVAEVVFDAIRKEQFYILPHAEWVEVIQLRQTTCFAWKIRKALRQRLPNSLSCVGEQGKAGFL